MKFSAGHWANTVAALLRRSIAGTWYFVPSFVPSPLEQAGQDEYRVSNHIVDLAFVNLLLKYCEYDTVGIFYYHTSIKDTFLLFTMEYFHPLRCAQLFTKPSTKDSLQCD